MDLLQSQVKLFRGLLYLYPAAFRHEYGREMEQFFADRLHSESRWRLWLDALADLVITAPKEHWYVLASDLSFATRTLAAAPGFTAVSLLVSALGIGATVSVFSLVNAVLLRSMPYGEPEKLVYLWSPNVNWKGVPQEFAPSIPDAYAWQRLSRSFAGMTMLRESEVNIIRQNSTMRVEAAYVTPSFFQTMQTWPVIGRSFGEKSKQPASENVAVISDALWRSHFGSDTATIGRQIQLSRKWYTVIGIMPKDFGFPFNGDIPNGSFESKQTDIWLPLVYTVGQKTNRTNIDSPDALIGRLRDGVSPTSAETELKAIESRLDPLYPAMWRGFTALVRPLVGTIIGPVQRMLWLLLGAVAMVLLIGISNLANLLLARSAARSHELGIRTALGAQRSRLTRQLLTESTLLSSVGAMLGVLVAYAAVRLLISLNPGDIPRLETATVDGRVLAFAAMLSIATGLLAGLVPALTASQASINGLLKRGGSRVAGLSHNGRSWFITLQIALSVILLASSGLLVRSYLRLAAVQPGFSPSTLTFRLRLDGTYSTPEARATFYKVFLQKLKTIDGVKFAGASNSIPLSHEETVTSIEIKGYGPSGKMIENRSVTPDYRKALGTPLLQGRDFSAFDVSSASPVVMVNHSFAKTYFQKRNALGGQVRLGIGNSSGAWSTVVGIVDDIRHNRLEEASQPQIFEPVASGENFAIASSVPAAQVVTEATAMLRLLDPGLGLESVHTMSQRMEESNVRRRFQTFLLTGFAGMAVLLALVGLYGLMSYAVKQRQAEIAVRLALGCSRASILGLIVWQGFRLTAYGLLVGLVAAVALTRLISGWLFGVAPLDPATFVAVPLFVLAIACCACVVPAFAATRVDPIQALRQE